MAAGIDLLTHRFGLMSGATADERADRHELVEAR
jgi:hypothetical protein